MRLFDTFTLGFVLAFAWMAFYVGVGSVCSRFACPRWGKALFAKCWYNNGFARRCVHWGLPKWAGPTVDLVNAQWLYTALLVQG